DLVEVHETPAKGLPPGWGSGVACSRQRLPSQPIVWIAPGDPPSPTAMQAFADTHDTDETSPGNGGRWNDQTAPRAGLTPTNITPTARKAGRNVDPLRRQSKTITRSPVLVGCPADVGATSGSAGCDPSCETYRYPARRVYRTIALVLLVSRGRLRMD